jgi:hypothetical protein
MPLTADAVAALAAKGLTLAAAEATTGGLIGHLLMEIPDSSRVMNVVTTVLMPMDEGVQALKKAATAQYAPPQWSSGLGPTGPRPR